MQIYDYITNNFSDTILSCEIPIEMHWERRMPDHGVIFVRDGKLIVNDRGETTEVPAGRCVFVRRDCAVDITKVSLDGQPYRGINFVLQRPRLKDYFAAKCSGLRIPSHIRALAHVATVMPQTVELEALFNSLTAYVDRRQAPADEMLSLKIHETIMALLAIDIRFFPTLFDFQETWKIDLLEFMERNFTEDLTMDEFALYTGRSLATFKRDFAKISDLPPQRWLINRRLDKAHEILSQSRATATDVAYRVGFKNRSHFCNAFKNYFGYAPGKVAAV